MNRMAYLTLGDVAERLGVTSNLESNRVSGDLVFSVY